jgi:hypothetical protein
MTLSSFALDLNGELLLMGIDALANFVGEMSCVVGRIA